MLNDKPGKFHVDEMGRLFFKPVRNWPIEELVVRISAILCSNNIRFEPFRKNPPSDKSWVLDDSNNWRFNQARPDQQGEVWPEDEEDGPVYFIFKRYYNDSQRPALEAIGAALVWMV